MRHKTEARQMAVDTFRDTYITKGMPQSKQASQFHIEQGLPSSQCAYQHEAIKNHGCAIGILPDFDTLPPDVQRSVESIQQLIHQSTEVVSWLKSLGFDPWEDSEFLTELQCLHDTTDHWEDGKFVKGWLEDFEVRFVEGGE